MTRPLVPWQISQLGICAAFAVVLSLFALLEDRDSGQVAFYFQEESLPDLCVIRNETGEPCPSCGLTRALVSILHGDPGDATEHHHAAVPIFALLLLQVLARPVLALLRPRGLKAVLLGSLDFGFNLTAVTWMIFSSGGIGV